MPEEWKLPILFKMIPNSEEASTRSEGAESSSTYPRSSDDQTHHKPKQAESDDAVDKRCDEVSSTSTPSPESPPPRRRQDSQSSTSMSNVANGHHASKHSQDLWNKGEDNEWLKQGSKDNTSRLLNA